MSREAFNHPHLGGVHHNPRVADAVRCNSFGSAGVRVVDELDLERVIRPRRADAALELVPSSRSNAAGR